MCIRDRFNSIRRLDILQELLDDEKITEIMVNGTVVFVEADGRVRKWEKEFSSTEVVENLVQRIDGPVSYTHLDVYKRQSMSCTVKIA